MAVRGFKGFRERFRDHQDQYILIGGAACELWFQQQGLRFRATQDIDMVLLLEALHADFVAELWAYVTEAEYQSLARGENRSPRLYRFDKTERTDVPKMIELLSRTPDALFPDEDQRIIPIRMEHAPSLSAILLNPAYYEFLLSHRMEIDRCPVADVHALLLFKARAWLDLTARKGNGQVIRSTDIAKHRTDVFRLAATLTSGQAIETPAEICHDLENFLSSFPPESDAWPAIQSGLRSSGLGVLPPEILIQTISSVYLAI